MCGPRTTISLQCPAHVLMGLEVDDLTSKSETGNRDAGAPLRVVDRIAVQARQLGGAVRAQPAEPRAFGDPVGDVLGDRVAAHIM